MRKLKFRGVCIKNGKYVYGGGIDSQRDTPVIINHGNKHFVDAKSIAQFTGLLDMHGVEIYEKDLVRWGHVNGYKENMPREAVVKLKPDLCFETFNLGEYNHTFHFGNFAYARVINKAMEVFGNTYDNQDIIDMANSEDA